MPTTPQIVEQPIPTKISPPKNSITQQNTSKGVIEKATSEPLVATTIEWEKYIDEKLQFEVEYPVNIDGRKVFLPKIETKVTGGELIYFILAADVENVWIQDRDPKETFRITVFRDPKGEYEFDEWAVLMSQLVGEGKLEQTNLGACRAWGISEINGSDNPVRMALWVDGDTFYYGIYVENSAGFVGIDHIIRTFKPKGC